MNLIDINLSMYIYFNKGNNKQGSKFKVSDYVRISKDRNIFAKGYVPNWTKEVFVITKVKNTVLYTYVISDLKDKETVGTFYENELQKTISREFRVGKVIKRKGDKLCVKWKG